MTSDRGVRVGRGEEDRIEKRSDSCLSDRRKEK